MNVGKVLLFGAILLAVALATVDGRRRRGEQGLNRQARRLTFMINRTVRQMEKQECSAQPVDFPDSNMGVQQQVSELRNILVNLRLQLDQCINGGQLESEAEFEDTLGDTSGDAPDCELY